MKSFTLIDVILHNQEDVTLSDCVGVKQLGHNVTRLKVNYAININMRDKSWWLLCHFVR